MGNIDFSSLTNLSLLQQIVYGFVGLFFIVISALLIWYYYRSYLDNESLKIKYADYSPWSFKGYWGRYKNNIIMFLAIVFAIIGTLFFGAILGIVVYNDIFGNSNSPSLKHLLYCIY